MTNSEIKSRVEELLADVGMTMQDFFKEWASANKELFNLNDSDYEKFVDTYNHIEKISKNKNGLAKKEKGKLLEDLMKILFESGEPPILIARKNCRTSTNEIDVLLEWNDNARYTGIKSVFPCFGDSFLCECKNYDGKVGVTYIGKFFSLLLVTKTKFGVMVAWDGITGRGKWTDANGLIKKIALSTNIYIIPIDKVDLKLIYNKKSNIFKIVHERYIALKNDINYENYIKPHEAEQEMTK